MSKKYSFIFVRFCFATSNRVLGQNMSSISFISNPGIISKSKQSRSKLKFDQVEFCVEIRILGGSLFETNNPSYFFLATNKTEGNQIFKKQKNLIKNKSGQQLSLIQIIE